jgi:type I restriction enzyme S subunit
MMPMADTLFQVFNIENHWILDEEKRLDASFYAKDVIASKVLIAELEEKGIEVKRIENLSDKIFWPGRFKRRYVSKKEGNPFLMPSEVIMFLPKAKKFIIGYPEEVSIQENWLLITRSGSIGRCLISTRLLEKFVLSDDLIRIVPKDENKVGYLYAYFNTWIGQAFLTKDRYGATVKHIEPHHVATIPIPIIPELDKEINQRILEAHRLREKAQELLLKAEKMIYSELELPEIDEDDVEYFGGEKGRVVKSFEIKASYLKLRLDASYHLPILQQIEANLSKSEFEDTKFGEVVDKIFIPTRFKRPYVNDSKTGIPFLQGSHVPQIKPMDVKYLWSGTKHLENILIKKDWILMTRSGTVGRIGIVKDGWKDWTASEHVLRIIIRPEIHPGYIAAFLSSPYGEYQIKGKIYGAVVDEIGEQDTSLIEEINIILPPKDIQDKIGNLVFEAYDKKDRANQIEDETIKLLERRLKEISD